SAHFFFERPGVHRALHSFPTRRSSDLMTRDADKILVPVLPSDIDIHACSRCIRDLLLVAKISRDENRIGVIANRIRRNTLTYQSDRKSTRLNSSHVEISYAVFCLKKKN